MDFITKNGKKIPISDKPHASPVLTNHLDDLADDLQGLKEDRYNGTSGYWKERIQDFEKATRLIKEQKLDQMQSRAVPLHPEGRIPDDEGISEDHIGVVDKKFGVPDKQYTVAVWINKSPIIRYFRTHDDAINFKKNYTVKNHLVVKKDNEK